jgi:predicted metal-dependent hydrolase
VPGTGSEPDRAPLEAAKRLVRAPVEAAAWESDAAYRYGASLCVHGFFWEAHEVWEAVWKACPPNGVERRLLRGLIAVANAALKLRMGRPNAALRLLREADALLAEAAAAAGSEAVMGVAVAPLRTAAQALLAAVEAGGGEGEVGRLLRLLASVADGWTPGETAL